MRPAVRTVDRAVDRATLRHRTDRGVARPRTTGLALAALAGPALSGTAPADAAPVPHGRPG